MTPLSSTGSMIARARARLRFSGLLLGCLVVLLSVGTVAAASSSHLTTATASGAKISAHLTKTRFTSSQAGKVKLIYKFSAPSKSFSYLLTFKKGAKWLKVKSVKKTGTFKGSHTMTVKKIFAGKPVKVGSYRLKLSADKGSKLLSFKVVKGPTGSGSTDGSKPAITSPPSISGTTTQGQTLSTTNGSWTNSPTSYTYQWRRCTTGCSDIPSATTSSYPLVYADAGSTIRVVVTAHNAYGDSSPATSDQTAVVVGLPPANSSPPSISGTTTRGHALSASNGVWSSDFPITYTYQWRRCDSSGTGCSDISSATSSSYILAYVDAGSTIRVVVTASNSYGSASATSDATGVVVAVQSITAGGHHTCALISNGTIECWGYDLMGQLGNGTIIGTSPYGILTPVQVTGITSATAVAAGGYHTCALIQGGTIKCWGYGYYGQLGNGLGAGSSLPVSVSSITTATAVAAGETHTCALIQGGTIKCWGYNRYGQVGNGTFSTSEPYAILSPALVSGITNATQVAAGYSHSCALLQGGTVKCWGRNYYGELGDGMKTDSSTPVSVSGITNATAVAVGSGHTCALISGGTIKCWGYGLYGQLGDGSTTDSLTPVQVEGLGGVDMLSNATAFNAGSYNHTCALISDGTVVCWGWNLYGQLGNGVATDSSTPVQVEGLGGVGTLSNATAVKAGFGHTCALISDGTVVCWGWNIYGALGNDTTTDSNAPVSVIGLP